MKRITEIWLKIYPKIITWRNLAVTFLLFTIWFFWKPVIDYVSNKSSVATTVTDKASGKVLIQTKISGGTPTISIAGTNVTANVAISYGGPAIAGGLPSAFDNFGTNFTSFPQAGEKIRSRPKDMAPDLELPSYTEINPGDEGLTLKPGEYAVIKTLGRKVDISPSDLTITPLETSKNLWVKNETTNTIHITLTWNR